MFDNIIGQEAVVQLKENIIEGKLPGSILFSGPECSGKLSCALETARVLSCREKGEWMCTCPSCLKHKALVSQNVMILGPGNKILEISAAKKTLLSQSIANTSHVPASRYLFIRACRKLVNRFSPVLWEGDDKLGKFSPLIESINYGLEQVAPGRALPDDDELKKLLDQIEADCRKLESSFLYDSLPVSQIRNISSWANLTSASGKKVLIMENADCMMESSKNALLKILEEPPEDVIFILLTSRRGSILPTILSRVRTYSFYERPVEVQKKVIEKVFHYNGGFDPSKMPSSINDFLQSYLPVNPDVIKLSARNFFNSIAMGRVPDINQTLAECSSFEPRILFRLFLRGIIDAQKELMFSKNCGGAGAESSAALLEKLRYAYNSVNVYNQKPQACLEELTRSIMQINYVNGGIFRQVSDD